MSVVEVEDLWKRFRIPHEKRATVFDQVGGLLSLLEGKRYSYEELWALRGITFGLQHGESLGIIGPNGSGKSTLLKLIARVMEPDKGTIRTSGSMATVLELGIGFHPDLTVKENAQVYGVIMGIPRSEISKRMDSILDFSELSRFQDAKLKSLSSGMHVRLAFSIAIQTEADMFLVDEALAVGDMDFQQKCLEKFREFKRQGKSILFVSHNMGLIRSFCERTLYLQNGEPRALGPSEEITSQYASDMGSTAGIAQS